MSRRWHLFWAWAHDMAKDRAYERYLRHCDRLAYHDARSKRPSKSPAN